MPHTAVGVSPKVAPYHGCDTCAKFVGPRECAVLKDLIGAGGDCWAWSDDPDWERKANAATSAYARARGRAWQPKRGLD